MIIPRSGLGTSFPLAFRSTTALRQKPSLEVTQLFAVLLWMVEVWRAIQNKTASSYVIKIVL
jgi:hypothetical protein